MGHVHYIILSTEKGGETHIEIGNLDSNTKEIANFFAELPIPIRIDLVYGCKTCGWSQEMGTIFLNPQNPLSENELEQVAAQVLVGILANVSPPK